MKQENVKRKIKIIVECIGIILVSSFIKMILDIIVCLFSQGNKLIIEILALCASTAISFIVVPNILSNFLNGRRLVKYKDLRISRLVTECCVVLFLFLVVIRADISTVLYFICIGISEEFLFRVLIIEYLKNNFSTFGVYIVDALLFSMVLHLNCDIFTNLLLRFPAGVLFVLVKEKIGFPEACITHGVYDVLVCLI